MRPFKSTISIDEARVLLNEHVRRLTRTERVPLARAAGRIASSDVAADVFVPPFSRSAMDGYAVIAADTIGASAQSPVKLPIAERIFTGNTPIQLVTPGSCAEIATGAPLPDGADAVVMVEETQRSGDTDVEILAPAAAGQNIGRRGADITPGDLVVRAGELLNSTLR